MRAKVQCVACAVAVLVGGLSAAPVLANQVAEFTVGQADGPLEEMIVTGEKRVRSLQDTQSSVALITEEELRSTYTPNLDELILRIPNVNNAFGDAGFTVRGVAQNGVDGGLNVPSANLTLTINVDDIPLTNSVQTLLGPLGAWDLARVEVFRGPQSTIQGRNALSGAILLYSKEPTYDWTGDAQVVFGSVGTRQYSAALGGPIVPDVLAFRVSYDHQESDGFTFNPTLGRDDVARNNNDLVRAKLLLEPADTLSVKLTGIYSDARGTAFQSFDLDTFQATGQRINTVDTPQRRFDESYLFGARVDWSPFDAWTLTSLTSYADTDNGRTTDGDGTDQPIAVFQQDTFGESFTQEVRAVYDGGGAISGLVGAFYANIDADSRVQGSFPSALFGFPGGFANLINNNDETTENFAFFGEIEWRALDRLTLLVGLRYDNETVDTESFSGTTFDPPDIGPALTPSGGLTDAEFDAFLPKAQITYDWTDTLSTSFTYQRGYRSGGAQLSLIGGSLPFDAEFTNNYEVALRSAWLDGRLTVNVNGFFIDWTDQQVQVPLLDAFPELVEQVPVGADTSVLTATVNAGQSELYGFEMEVDANPMDGLSLYASLGYVETTFNDFPVAGGLNFAGNDFRFSPGFSASVGGNYEHASGFFVSGNVNYSDGQFSDNENTPGNRSDSFVLANLRAGFRTDRFSIAGFANNLFDEEYLTFQDVNFNQGQGGTERVYGVQATATF